VHRVEFNLSGLPVSISSEARPLLDTFRSAWLPFQAAEAKKAAPPFLDVVLLEDVARVVDSAPITKDVHCRIVDGDLEIRSRDAAATVDRDGRCLVTVGTGAPLTQYYAVANALMAAVAFQLPRFGGVLLHAAAIVVDDRAFLLLGRSGAGKSTWAWSAKASGAGFLSDDVVAVQAGPAGARVLSVPFRANHPTPLPPARWPIGAVLLPQWGEPAALLPAPALRTHLAIESAVLYPDLVTDRAARAAIVDAIAAAPVRTCVFPRSGGFVEVLRRFR